MVKMLGACIEKQMSAFSTKKVKVYIGVSSVPPDTRSEFERVLSDGVYEDPDEVAGKLMDLTLTPLGGSLRALALQERTPHIIGTPSIMTLD